MINFSASRDPIRPKLSSLESTQRGESEFDFFFYYNFATPLLL
jgi:hypothetical protein